MSSVNAASVLKTSAAVIGACYAGSYVWEKVTRPEAKQAQNEIKEFKKLVSGEVDDQALVKCLHRMRGLTSMVNKQELLGSMHLFTALCSGTKTEFKYALPVVDAAVDLIISLCRGDSDKMIVRVGGVKTLFVALTKAYTLSMNGGPLAAAAKSLVEKLLNVLEEVLSFDEKEVVLSFDVPASAAAVRQLVSIKTCGSITMLLNAAHGFTHKRTKVLGIISSLTSIRQGAELIAAQETDGLRTIDHLLSLAAKSDSKAPEYTRATMCVRNLVRHVASCRARVLSTEQGYGDLTNLPRFRDQFIELIDGGSIGYPPRTQQAAPRDVTAVSAGIDALTYLLESADTHDLALEALLDANQRGLLALFGVMARCESPALRNRVASELLGPMSMLDNEIGMFVHAMKGYTGSGEHSERWGTGFRVAQELHAREQKEQARAKMAQRQQQRSAQNQLLQQMLMGGGGGAPSEEELMMQQMMMGGMGGPEMGMPPMSEEQMMMMMQGMGQ